MTYSIQNGLVKLLPKNKTIPTYIDWQITTSLHSLYKKYRENYTIINDVKIYNISYFSLLADLFSANKFSLTEFKNKLNCVVDNLYNKVYSEQYNYYMNIAVSEYPDYEEYSDIDYDNFYKEVEKKALKDSNNLEPYLIEISEKNSLILEEFKQFIEGFSDYIKLNNPREFGSFVECYNLLSKDINFFTNSKVKSIKKYVFTIGSYTQVYKEARGKNNNFIPAGYCSYGKQIFMNSEPTDNLKYGRKWSKKTFKHVFYHEVGHALDRLYYDEKVLKNTAYYKQSSFNKDFLKICELNYKNFKKNSHQLKKKTISWLSYFSQPSMKRINLPKKSSNYKENFLEKLTNDVTVLFDTKEKINSKIFSPKIKKCNIEYDYSRVLEETWSESFAFIFNLMKNYFSEYDKYIINGGISNDRTYIKLNYKSLIYILDNFDWEKLNISYAVFLRKRIQIKKFLNYVNDMPLILNQKRIRPFKTKKYLKFNDMLKHR